MKGRIRGKTKRGVGRSAEVASEPDVMEEELAFRLCCFVKNITKESPERGAHEVEKHRCLLPLLWGGGGAVVAGANIGHKGREAALCRGGGGQDV